MNISVLLFVIIAIIGVSFFAYNIWKIKFNIGLGLPEERSDQKGARLKTMLLVAFGQKKMFSRPIPALLHLCLYVAFVITQIELFEIFTDGVLDEHRFFRSSLGGLYTFTISFIEILSVSAFIATIVFLARRNLLKLPRLKMKEMIGWPTKDANLILIFELILLICIFTMNGADEVLFQRGASHAEMGTNGSFGFSVSSILGPILFDGLSTDSLHIAERVGWWGHLIMVLGFLNYLPYSKHFHILLAFPNTYYSNLEAKGKFSNMDSVTKEVKLMMDPTADPYAAPDPGTPPPSRFGAKDVTGLKLEKT